MATGENFYIGKVFNYYSVLYRVTIIKKKKKWKNNLQWEENFFIFFFYLLNKRVNVYMQHADCTLNNMY